MEIGYTVQIDNGEGLSQVGEGSRKVVQGSAWQTALTTLIDELYQKYGTWAVVNLTLMCESPSDI